jgi:outer membrane protein insertion porin family
VDSILDGGSELRSHPVRRLIIGDSPTRFIALGVSMLVAALLGWTGGTLCAQTAGPSVRITDIRVTGLKRVPADKVMQAIRLRTGDVFSLQAVDEDIRRLDSLGYFYPTAIDVRQESYQGGVRLLFDLKERPVITSLRFEGNRAFSDKKLRDTVGLKEGAFLDFARQRESTSRILDLYRSKRYQFVEVERREESNPDQNTVAITYAVKEGPRVTLRAVRVVGNRAFPSKQLLAQMETRTHEWVLFHKVFDEPVFKLDLLRLREFYREHGYLDAVVSGDYEYSADKTGLTLIVRISEGSPYRVGDVTLRGQKIVTGEQLLRELRMRKGQTFGTDKYQRDLEALQGYYTSRGYLDVRVEPKEVFPEPGRIDLVYTIAENRQYNLGMLDIRGNFKTKDKVIRREFEIFPGDVFNSREVARGLERLRALGFFKTVETTVAPGEEPGERNLIVEVEEGRTGNLMFGVGVSSNNGLIGQFQVSFENFDIADWPKSLDDLLTGNAFVGAGQKLLLQFSPGTELTQARIFFADPYIFDTRYSFSTDLYLRERAYEDYHEGRLGARFGLGRKLTDRLSARLTYRLEQVDISELDTTAPDVLAAEGESAIRSLAFNLTYDRTDSPLMPTKGYRLSGTVETAADFLGSDWNFVKGVVDAGYYHTLFETRSGRKHILALKGSVGAMDAFGGDSSVPFFERFFAGGRNSVRGFSYRGLGPEQDGTQVGGEFSFVGSAEYLFPIYQTVVQRQPYEMIRGVLFCDVGQVAYTLSDITDTKLRVSVGVGVRLQFPGLGGIPIALDLGFPVIKESTDETQVFSFNIGTIF